MPKSDKIIITSDVIAVEGADLPKSKIYQFLIYLLLDPDVKFYSLHQIKFAKVILHRKSIKCKCLYVSNNFCESKMSKYR